MNSTTNNKIFIKLSLGLILKNFILPFINFALHDTVIKAIIIDHYATLTYTNTHTFTHWQVRKYYIIDTVSTTSPLHKIWLSENEEKKNKISFLNQKSFKVVIKKNKWKLISPKSISS